MSDPIFECRSASVTLPLRGFACPCISVLRLYILSAEFLSIVGPSGTGKAMLLKMLGGLSQPTAEQVLVNGKVLDGPPEDVVIDFHDYANA